MIVSSLPKDGMFSFGIDYLWIHGQEFELQLLFLDVFFNDRNYWSIFLYKTFKNCINIFNMFDWTSNSNKFISIGFNL